MKSVKIIFIAMEVAFLTGILLVLFATDWTEAIEQDKDWMFKVLVILMSYAAVVCQTEQLNIPWEKEDYNK